GYGRARRARRCFRWTWPSGRCTPLPVRSEEVDESFYYTPQEKCPGGSTGHETGRLVVALVEESQADQAGHHADGRHEQHEHTMEEGALRLSAGSVRSGRAHYALCGSWRGRGEQQRQGGDGNKAFHR